MSNVLTFRASADAEAVVRQDVVHSLHEALTGAVRGIGMIPGFVREAFEKKVWHHERAFAGGTMQPPVTFAEFVHEPYPVGLGSTYDVVRQFLVKDAATLTMWDEAVARPLGVNQHSAERASSAHTLPSPPRPTTGSSSAAIRRLRKAANVGDAKASDLLDKVKSGEVKPNRAAIEMGWKKPTLTVVDEANALWIAARKRVDAFDAFKLCWSDMTVSERREALKWALDHMAPDIGDGDPA